MDIRGKNCSIHVELLDASLLEPLVRNEDRERREYCLEPEKVHEAYEVMSQLATYCHKRDFRSQKYYEMYKLLYSGKWCAWEDESCRNRLMIPESYVRSFVSIATSLCSNAI
jgi:hypothetical protein